jgi:hypothetical protein
MKLYLLRTGLEKNLFSGDSGFRLAGALAFGGGVYNNRLRRTGQ